MADESNFSLIDYTKDLPSSEGVSHDSLVKEFVEQYTPGEAVREIMEKPSIDGLDPKFEFEKPSPIEIECAQFFESLIDGNKLAKISLAGSVKYLKAPIRTDSFTRHVDRQKWRSAVSNRFSYIDKVINTASERNPVDETPYDYSLTFINEYKNNRLAGNTIASAFTGIGFLKRTTLASKSGAELIDRVTAKLESTFRPDETTSSDAAIMSEGILTTAKILGWESDWEPQDEVFKRILDDFSTQE